MIRTRNLLIWSQTRYHCATGSCVSLYLGWAFKIVHLRLEMPEWNGCCSDLLLTTIELKCEVNKMLMNETQIACLSDKQMCVVELKPIDIVDYFRSADLHDTRCRHIFINYSLISPLLPFLLSVAPSSHNFLRGVNKSRRSRFEHADNVSILSVYVY